MIQSRALRTTVFAVTLALFLCDTAVADPRPVHYKISVNAANLAGYDIEIRIPTSKSTVLLAMAAHPEYDDRYFRYVENFSAESGGRNLSFTKADESVWKIDNVRGG